MTARLGRDSVLGSCLSLFSFSRPPPVVTLAATNVTNRPKLGVVLIYF
jgi:hypothetical protein